MEVNIEHGWKKKLHHEFEQPYFHEIVRLLKAERSAGKTVYPPGPCIFNAFDQTPFNKVKAVILGQDPYHGPHQAHGLSFSVLPGTKLPPSLVNIFKELKDDLGVQIPAGVGDLTPWANQGVLLLNASLTVRAGEPMSHAKIGWSRFTDAVIQKISDDLEGIVFILWGKFAQDKASLVNADAHHLIRSAHPSPLAAHNGFFGSKPFSKTNHYLTKEGKDPIDWSLPAA